MPRDPADVVILQTYQARAQAYASALGATDIDSLSDLEHHQIANEVLRENLGTLYQGARVGAGDTLDFSTAPDLAQRLAAAGATDESLREFVSGVYPHLSPSAAMKAYAADLQRSRGADVPAEPKTQSLFDRPY